MTPVFRVVRRYNGLLWQSLECAKLLPSSGPITLSGIISLFVFACLTPASQLKWPLLESIPLTTTPPPPIYIRSSSHVFIAPWNLHKTLQLDIWANICLKICFSKINCYLVYFLLKQNTLSYFVLYFENILSLIFHVFNMRLEFSVLYIFYATIKFIQKSSFICNLCNKITQFSNKFYFMCVWLVGFL